MSDQQLEILIRELKTQFLLEITYSKKRVLRVEFDDRSGPRILKFYKFPEIPEILAFIEEFNQSSRSRDWNLKLRYILEKILDPTRERVILSSFDKYRKRIGLKRNNENDENFVRQCLKRMRIHLSRDDIEDLTLKYWISREKLI